MFFSCFLIIMKSKDKSRLTAAKMVFITFLVKTYIIIFVAACIQPGVQ